MDSNSFIEYLFNPDGTESNVFRDDFAIRFTGKLRLKKGYYMFGIWSDDGSMMYIDGSLVINNDGVHGRRGRFTPKMYFNDDVIDIEAHYFERGGNANVQLMYLPLHNVHDEPLFDLSPSWPTYGWRNLFEDAFSDHVYSGTQLTVFDEPKTFDEFKYQYSIEGSAVDVSVDDANGIYGFEYDLIGCGSTVNNDTLIKSVDVGEVIEIRGNGFLRSNISVEIGGKDCDIERLSMVAIACIVPELPVGEYRPIVKYNLGNSVFAGNVLLHVRSHIRNITAASVHGVEMQLGEISRFGGKGFSISGVGLSEASILESDGLSIDFC